MRRCFHHPGLMFLALVLGAAASGGCAPGWQVVRDAGSPSPLRAAGPITVSFDYSRLIVDGKNERDFVESRKVEKPDYEQSWLELKKQFETNFMNGMAQEYPAGVAMGPGGPAGVHVVVFQTGLKIGHYMVVTATNTTMNAEMAFTANGQPADVIAVGVGLTPTAFRPTIFAHVPPLSADIGKLTGRFAMSKNK